MQSGLAHNGIRSIFQDSSGMLWFGTENGLNSYDGYDIRNYTDESIPSTEWITAIVEDRDGLLWLGTSGTGVRRFNRFTGSCKNYMHEPGNNKTIYDNSVNSLIHCTYPGFQGFWAGTSSGLSLLITDKGGEIERIINFKVPSADGYVTRANVINILMEDAREGNRWLWVGTRNGLYKFYYNTIGKDEETRTPRVTWEHFSEFENIRVLALCNIESDGVKSLWLGTNSGLCRMTAKHETKHESTPGQKPYTLKWYREIPGDPTSLSCDIANSVIEDPNEPGKKLWVGTWEHGLNHMDIEAGTFYRHVWHKDNPGGLSDSRLKCLLTDRSGILWIGTLYGGVNKLIYGPMKLKFTTIRRIKGNPQSLSHENVRTIAEQPRSNGKIIWIGTLGGGLNKWNRETGEFTHFLHDPAKPGTISHKDVYSIYFDRAGTLWAGTLRGLDRMEKDGTFTHFLPHPLKPDTIRIGGSVRCIYEDRSGTMWIGTMGGGLNAFERESGTFKHYRYKPGDINTVSDDNVYCIRGTIENGKEILWLGTFGGGLNRFDPETGQFKHYPYKSLEPDSSGSGYIISIYQSSVPPGKNTAPGLWMGTYGGGLIYFDFATERFTRYTMKENLPDHTVYGILEDDKGNLWLSTNMGISRFNIRRKSFRNYFAVDGLQGAEFNGGAYWHASTGEMFYGGIFGLNVFHPAQVKENTYVPPIVLTVYRNLKREAVIDQTVSRTRSLKFSTKDRMIGFHFSALDYLNPSENTYAYRLEGFDKEWVYHGSTRTVNYTHLMPGNYVFKVKGANSDGIWNEKGVSVNFEIVPTFWETPWIKIMIGVTIFLIAFSIHRWVGTIRRKRYLEQQVEERTKKLRLATENAQQMAVQAESANRAKSAFLANMSHEIRTPMAGITGLTDMALDSDPDEPVRKHLKEIKQSANQLLGLLNDILDLSKIEAGQLDLEYVTFKLRKAVNEVEALVIPGIHKKGLTFETAIHKDVPGLLTGDPVRFKQILINLVGNAVKFTELGGITVHVSKETSEKSEDQTGATVQLYIKVSDTGIGIPEDRRDSIFESFTQVDGSISRKYGGTGLGLAITRQLVEMMEGKIWLESTPGQGTVFHYTIPFALPGKPETGTYNAYNQKGEPGEENKNKALEDTGEIEAGKNDLMEQLSALSGSTRILLVEDNPINRKVASALIQRTGIPVETVDDGIFALEALRKNTYHLILMDVQMPRMDGLTATRQIREEIGLKDVPIIAMTANAMKEDRLRCLEAGMNDYITKPFKPEYLYGVLVKWLSKTG